MSIREIIIYFITGGTLATLIIGTELFGLRALSALASIFPVFTLISYIFIGDVKGGEAVRQHALFVITGTLLAWIPYMIAVAYFAPRIGPYRALLVGLMVFFVLSAILLWVISKYHLFQG